MAIDRALGNSIRRARERKRWTQRQLADALGVNVKTVDNWENGRSSPKSSIGALEDVLDVTFGDEPQPRSASREELAEKMRQLEELAREVADMVSERNQEDEPNGDRHRRRA